MPERSRVSIHRRLRIINVRGRGFGQTVLVHELKSDLRMAFPHHPRFIGDAGAHFDQIDLIRNGLPLWNLDPGAGRGHVAHHAIDGEDALAIDQFWRPGKSAGAPRAGDRRKIWSAAAPTIGVIQVKPRSRA